MKTAGIIAEYNPFHRGHAWHIAETRRLLGQPCAVVCVISGNWVQQADCSVADKWLRTRLALAGGADLVLELPTPWATASAETFAHGGVQALAAAGVVDVLCFGSEAGTMEQLRTAAQCLDSGAYRAQLKRFLESGASFPAARQAAAHAMIGPAAGCLSAPNNNLGVEYLRAVRALGCPMETMTVSRRGAAHHALSASEGFASATQIRRLLRDGQWPAAAEWMLPGSVPLLREAGLADLSRCERAILAKLRSMTAQDWSLLPDAGAAEGLPERLYHAARQASSLEEFYAAAKTRRYTHARLRRLALRAFLGLSARDCPQRLPYLRVLGLNAVGQRLLREMKSHAALPVITKPAHARSLGEAARRLFELESRCTDLYALCLERPWPCGREFTAGPVISA